jgi:hypothetical protein
MKPITVKTCLLNTRSILSNPTKTQFINEIIEHEQPDIFIMTETWLTKPFSQINPSL